MLRLLFTTLMLFSSQVFAKEVLQCKLYAHKSRYQAPGSMTLHRSKGSNYINGHRLQKVSNRFTDGENYYLIRWAGDNLIAVYVYTSLTNSYHIATYTCRGKL